MRTSPTGRPTRHRPAYLELLALRAGAARRGRRPRALEVSLKLSALGQAALRDGEKIAATTPTPSAPASRDRRLGHLDAEDHTTTGSGRCRSSGSCRIRIGWARFCRPTKRTRGRPPGVRRLERASGCARASAIRTDAYRDPREVPELPALPAGADGLLCTHGRPHDPGDRQRSPARAAEFRRGVDDFEYQMYYGIRDAEQRRLARRRQPRPGLSPHSARSGTATSSAGWPNARRISRSSCARWPSVRRLRGEGGDRHDDVARHAPEAINGAPHAAQRPVRLRGCSR